MYQTVLLAFQRYLAISKPMEYYASQSAAGMTSKWIFDPFLTQENLTYLSTIFAGGGTDWIITLKYTMPNLIFSILFNLPKFFEFDMQEIMELNSENNVTLTKIKLLPTKLRLNDNYVFYSKYARRDYAIINCPDSEERSLILVGLKVYQLYLLFISSGTIILRQVWLGF